LSIAINIVIPPSEFYDLSITDFFVFDNRTAKEPLPKGGSYAILVIIKKSIFVQEKRRNGMSDEKESPAEENMFLAPQDNIEELAAAAARHNSEAVHELSPQIDIDAFSPENQPGEAGSVMLTEEVFEEEQIEKACDLPSSAAEAAESAAEAMKEAAAPPESAVEPAAVGQPAAFDEKRAAKEEELRRQQAESRRAKIIEEIEKANINNLRAALKDSDVNAQDSFGTTPLHLAVSYGQLEAVQLLLQHGADVCNVTNSGSTVMHAATGLKEGQKHVIIDLLLEKGADINHKDNFGQTPLHLEARWGNYEDIEYLIARGADVLASDNQGASALHYAVATGNIDSAKTLLVAGASIDHADQQGRLPIDWVAAGDTLMLRLLNDYRLIEDIKKNKPFEDIEELLQNGAGPDAADAAKSPALNLAVYYPEAERLSELLISLGAHVNTPDAAGRLALHLAAMEGYTNLVSLHLNHGAKVNARDNDEKTPFQLAEEHGHTEVSAVLKAHGGRSSSLFNRVKSEEDPQAKTKQAEKPDLTKRTPLHNIIEENQKKVEKLAGSPVSENN
jgi:ankyrin repeat protein